MVEDPIAPDLFARVRCEGELRVPRSRQSALQLFTARGERLWVDAWQPIFPAGDEDRDTTVGTVWLNHGHGAQLIWTVAEASADSIRYVRVIPGFWAGTVEIRCGRGDEGSNVTRVLVNYDTTPLSLAGQDALEEFAAGFADLLSGWERDIAAACS